MGHRFTVYCNNQLLTVDQFDLIPSEFDFLIEFLPEIPPEPHSDQQHQEIHLWEERFQNTLKREKSCQQ